MLGVVDVLRERVFGGQRFVDLDAEAGAVVRPHGAVADLGQPGRLPASAPGKVGHDGIEVPEDAAEPDG